MKSQARWETRRAKSFESATRLATLADEEVPKCVWERLFALLPADTDAERHHLSPKVVLGPPLVPSSPTEQAPLPEDEAELVCELPLSEI